MCSLSFYWTYLFSKNVRSMYHNLTEGSTKKALKSWMKSMNVSLVMRFTASLMTTKIHLPINPIKSQLKKPLFPVLPCYVF